MHRWARLIGRTMWFWIVAWPVVAIGVWASAPRIPTLLADDATGFLPADMPSQRAFERLRAEFPDQAPASRAAIVFARDSGMTSADKLLLADMAGRLQDRTEELGWRIRASALNPMLTRFLESPDGKAAVIAIDLPAALLTHSTVRRVREVKDIVAAHVPAPGASVEVTGSGALGELLDKHAKRDVNATGKRLLRPDSCELAHGSLAHAT